MANQLIIERALDENGYVLPGAKATITLTGTTTLTTVYSDSAGTIPAANPIVADANGFWPQRFVNVTPRAVVTDADDATLYTLDPVPTTFATGAAAQGISFEPSIAVPESNVQDAIEYVANSVLSGVSAYGIGVTGNAPLLANIDATDTASGIYRWDGASTGTFPAGITAATTGLIEFDRQTAAEGVQRLRALGQSRTYIRFMASTAWGAWLEAPAMADPGGNRVLGWDDTTNAFAWFAPNYTWVSATTSGASVYDAGSIPAWVSDIVCVFAQVSLTTKTDFSTIQVGTGGTPETTGYDGNTAQLFDGTAITCTNNTTSFVIGSSLGNVSGTLRLLKRSGANEWVAMGSVRRVSAGGAQGINTIAGVITLGGALDIVRLIRSGAGNYNGGTIAVGYR